LCGVGSGGQGGPADVESDVDVLSGAIIR
jgi:hypothetical protein